MPLDDGGVRDTRNLKKTFMGQSDDDMRAKSFPIKNLFIFLAKRSGSSFSLSKPDFERLQLPRLRLGNNRGDYLSGFAIDSLSSSNWQLELRAKPFRSHLVFKRNRCR